MKVKVSTLLLGLCLLITVTPAFARSQSAYELFKVIGSKPTYSCLTEAAGAVVNQCTFPVTLSFDLVIDQVQGYGAVTQNYWGGTAAQETFSCTLYAFDGNGNSITGTTVNFTGPHQTLEPTVFLNAAGQSITMICYNIPPGGGVANINW